MTTDGGLRQEFRRNVRDAMWVPIESWGTGQGLPDMHYCLGGEGGWIENKKTGAWALSHKLSPEQVGWMESYARHGGRALLAVRRQCAGGVRRQQLDELWLFGPEHLREIATTNSIKDVTPLLHCAGGPARWDWAAVRDLMTRPIAKLSVP